MNILIVEDEQAAAKNLKYLIHTVEPSASIENVIDTVYEAINYFNNNPTADLVFMDIHLADGICFDIFEKVKTNIPIIFTTAYDEYAMKAFKVNSIDYLLKPIDADDLKESINKYKSLQHNPINPDKFLELIELINNTNKKSHKQTYLVQQRDTLIPLSVDDVAYFTIDLGIIKAITMNKESYVLDRNLDDIESDINPKLFFRVNRQYIVQRKAIKDLKLYFNGKLILNVNPPAKEQIIISKAKAPVLKAWLNGF